MQSQYREVPRWDNSSNFWNFILCNFLVWKLQCFQFFLFYFQNLKKFIIGLIFLLPISPYPAQISISVPWKLITAWLRYTEFGCISLRQFVKHKSYQVMINNSICRLGWCHTRGTGAYGKKGTGSHQFLSDTLIHGLRTPNEGINQRDLKLFLMWQTKYASSVLKNLRLGLNYQPCSEDYFFSGRP